jgi:adenine-specific DNA-methyltransferase
MARPTGIKTTNGKNIEKDKKGKNNGKGKRITRYTFEELKEPRTPETGHTNLISNEEQVVTLLMDNGWPKAIETARLPESDKPVVIDMDPAVDPVLLWSGKRNRRTIPLLPLQRNEIVTESRIGKIIDRTRARQNGSQIPLQGLFADAEKSFREADKTKRIEFYRHDEGWRNKLICGDSLHVMESLLKFENLRGGVQMIFLDPPYGINYDSNFQQRVDSVSNDKDDESDDVLTVKAFRDTWVLGVHSYLSYLEERLYLCRELLSNSGSIFLQISDENIHRARCLMDEVFGAENFIALIPFRKKTMPFGTTFIEQMADFLVWYGKRKFTDNGGPNTRFYPLFTLQDMEGEFHHCWYEMPDGTRHRMAPDELNNHRLLPKHARVYRLKSLEPSGPMSSGKFTYKFEGRDYPPPKNGYGTTPEGMDRLRDLRRLQAEGTRLTFILYADESSYTRLTAP